MKMSTVISVIVLTALFSGARQVHAGRTNEQLYSAYTGVIAPLTSLHQVQIAEDFLQQYPAVLVDIVHDIYTLEFLLSFKKLELLELQPRRRAETYEAALKCLALLPAKAVEGKDDYAAKICLVLARMYLQNNWISEAAEALRLAQRSMISCTGECCEVEALIAWSVGDKQRSGKLFRKAFALSRSHTKAAYCAYAQFCFDNGNSGKAFSLLEECMRERGIDPESPEEDCAAKLYFRYLNRADRIDVENLYETFGAFLATTDLTVDNRELFIYLLNQRRFLALYFPYIFPEDDVALLTQFLK